MTYDCTAKIPKTPDSFLLFTIILQGIISIKSIQGVEIMARSKIDKRSLAKTLTWRFIATTTTIFVAFILTGSVLISLEIGSLEVILKTIFYYLHEKSWERVDYGKDEMVAR